MHEGEAGISDPIPYSMILSPIKNDIGSMTKKEKVMKVVDESTDLWNALYAVQSITRS